VAEHQVSLVRIQVLAKSGLVHGTSPITSVSLKLESLFIFLHFKFRGCLMVQTALYFLFFSLFYPGFLKEKNIPESRIVDLT